MPRRPLCWLLLALASCSDPARWGESGNLDFPYPWDAGVYDDEGTLIGAGLAAGGAVGAWDAIDPVFERTLHVRPPGTSYGAGDGSTWSDALSGLPASLERGARYLVAAGEYYQDPGEGYFDEELDDPVDGTRVIGVVKATAADHGSDVGWEAALAEGPARFGPLAFTTGYYLIDGRTGVGGDAASYGISVSSRDCADRRDAPITFPWNTETTNLSLRHLDVGDCGHRPDPTNGSEDAIYGYAGVSRLAVKHCYVHDAFRQLTFLQSSSDVLIEGTTFARGGLHHEAGSIAVRASSDVAIRRNVFINSFGVFLSLQNSHDVEISGNVFRRTLEHWDVWAAIMISDLGSSITVSNNTFYNLAGLNVGVRDGTGAARNLTVVNNLWAGARTAQIMLSGTHGTNAFWDNRRDEQLLDEAIDEPSKQILAGDPFVDGAAGDLRLAVPTAAGATLAPPRDVDLLGVTRGADGVWDRGAYERQE